VSSKPIYVIDGAAFRDLEGFFDEIQRSFVLTSWGRNLDAFNDVLRGGFGTLPDGGFVLQWRYSERSRKTLGYPTTIRTLEKKVRLSAGVLRADLASARRGEGPTIFDILVEIIRTHGPGGREGKDGVELELT
jgi:RNAse (barnase) inhibitor barstar